MPQDPQGRYDDPPESRSDYGLASAARTTSSNSTAFTVDDVVDIQGTLVITAVSGTNPTLDVILQTSVDGTNWDTVGSFPQQTATTTGRGKAFGAALGSQARWAWTIGGTATPTFTFRIDALVNRDS
jgi:hypothetical protein